jgi:shikimate dehydrogenase
MTRLAVLGSPISHSLSPTIQHAAYVFLGLDWQYEAIEVHEGGLREFLQGCDSDWLGLSLTIPLKAEAIRVCSEVDALASQVGGANTITWAGSITRAHNTDVAGFETALALAGVNHVASAVILGGGATARAAVAAVSQLTDQVTVYVRDAKREEGLRKAAGLRDIKLQVAPWIQVANGLSAPLVISTTPQGVNDFLGKLNFDAPGLLFESLYDPWPTKLVSSWERAGGRVIGGLELLVGQAIEQIRLFVGDHEGIDVSALRDVMLIAGRAELTRRNTMA